MISQFTGAIQFGKQMRFYWILTQRVCDTGGMGGGGLLRIRILFVAKYMYAYSKNISRLQGNFLGAGKRERGIE